MILELDLGNTRAKWRILDGRSEIIARGADSIVRWLDEGLPAAWSNDIARVRVASVLSLATESQLLTKMQSMLAVSPEIAQSTPQCVGVLNAYAEPWRLGVDRWLAVIAAFKRVRKAVLVIDIGTALKVDAVNDRGLHLGGYIIPGVQLMERALFEGTDRVRYAESSQLESVQFGTDTRSCVQNGIAAAAVGSILVAIHQCRSLNPDIYITGGFGLQIKNCLEAASVQDVHFDADLVLEGLGWALP